MGIFNKRREEDMAFQRPVAKAAISIFSKRRLANAIVNALPDKTNNGQNSALTLPDNFDSLEQCNVAVTVHTDRLKEIKTIPEKGAYKLKALADIEPFVNEYVEEGHNYPNSVAVECAIWRIDSGLIETGLKLALLLIEQNQNMPPRFNSSMPVWLCDSMYDWAAVKLKAGESASPYFDDLITKIEQCTWELYEPVGSKILAMGAKLANVQKNYAKVVWLGNMALEMNDKAGVKKIVGLAQLELDKSK